MEGERKERRMVRKTVTEPGYVNLTITVPAGTWNDPRALAAYLAEVAESVSRKEGK